jgi:uncharacterized protein (DUF58 family)
MRFSPLVLAQSALVGWCLFLGIVVHRPELFLVALPLLGALLSARSPAGPSGINTGVEVAAARVCEGDPLMATVTVGTSVEVPLLEILLLLPPNLALTSGSNRRVVSLRPGAEVKHTFHLRAIGRGRSNIGPLHLRLSDRSGLIVREKETDRTAQIEVYPAKVAVQHLPRPLQPRSSFGNYLSPRVGDGLEPADIRPFVPGDRVRHINWRTSLRLRRLHVTQYHQERNADVVLLLDTYAEAVGPAGTTLDASVRAAAALAATYLSRRDRVGLVELGGQLRWIRPTSGRRHLEGLLQALLPADITFTYVVRHLDVVPPRVLPPRALVVAISPLLDERFIKALKDLGARRFDVFVLAISPVAVMRRALASSAVTDLACRLWAAERRVMLDDLRRNGLTILEWDPADPLEGTLAPLGRWRPARELAL